MTTNNRDRAPLQSEGDLNVSPLRAEWAQSHLDARTREILEEDARWFIHQSLSTPCLNALQGCHDASLEDIEGRQILDFHGNNVHQVGLGHPHVIRAIVHQLQTLSFCPRRYTNLPAIQLAKRLAHLAPGNLNRVLFAPGGTSAIGMALKLARVITGRHKTLSWWDSFHGASLDAISVGGEAIFRSQIGPLLPGSEHVPPPEPHRCPFHCGSTCSLACADYLEYVLDKEQDVAAVIAEPIRCTPTIPPLDYWKKIRAACDRHNTLLIFDEIPTGLGRTGRTFACEHYDVVPDMLVLGKGLGGGILPLAALIARDEFAAAAADRALGHYTHEKNPVLCAAGLATLDLLESEKLPARARDMGALTVSLLQQLALRYPCLGEVRGIGLLIGLDIVRDRETMTPDTKRAERLMYESLRRGLSFKVTMGNRITLTPALTISESDLRRAVHILDECLAATGSPSP